MIFTQRAPWRPAPPCANLAGMLPAATLDSLPVLYVIPGCPACEQISEFLEGRGISHRRVNIHERPSGRREMEIKAGAARLPVLDWHGRILAAFDTRELSDFLRSRDVKLEDG